MEAKPGEKLRGSGAIFKSDQENYTTRSSDRGSVVKFPSEQADRPTVRDDSGGIGLPELGKEFSSRRSHTPAQIHSAGTSIPF